MEYRIMNNGTWESEMVETPAEYLHKMIWDNAADYLTSRGWIVSPSLDEYEEGRKCVKIMEEGLNAPAEYLKTLWANDAANNVIMRAGSTAWIYKEDYMGTEDHTDIWRVVMDGVELLNLHKKFTIREQTDENGKKLPGVIFHNPATIVFWEDNSKTVVTCMDNVVNGKPKPADTYSKETGLALCFMKKALGNKGNYNNVFRKWIDD